jgi:hypothetical protein
MEAVHGENGGKGLYGNTSQLHVNAWSLRLPKKWAVTLATELLECTHGQWLYRNIIIHDKVEGTLRSLHKEHILLEIEAQLASKEPLSEGDQYLLEINTGDIRNGTGEFQEYWLLVIQAARRAKQARDHTPEGIG